MRHLAALLLAALAPVASAATVPLAAPETVPLPPLPAAPVPALELAPAPVPARVAVDEERLVVHADVPDLPLLETPDVHLARAAHATPRAEPPAPAAPAVERRLDRPTVTMPRPAPAAPPAEPAPAPLAATPPEPRDADAPDAAAPPAPPEPAPVAPPPAPAWPRAAALAGAVALLLAPFALYHRLRGARTLEQATRARLHALLRERPGLTVAEAARELGVDPKTARYHLQRLAKEGLAVAEGPARRVRHFAAHSVAPAERAPVAAARASRDVLDAVLRAPGLTKTQLAEALGVARPTVNWHLRRLLGAGLVRCERDGKGVRVHPASLPKALNSQAV